MADVTPVGRTVAHTVPVVVRMISPEVTGPVPTHHVSLTRRYTVHVVGIVHAHVVTVTVVSAGITVSLTSGGSAAYNLAVSGQTGTGNVGRLNHLYVIVGIASDSGRA